MLAKRQDRQILELSRNRNNLQNQAANHNINNNNNNVEEEVLFNTHSSSGLRNRLFDEESIQTENNRFRKRNYSRDWKLQYSGDSTTPNLDEFVTLIDAYREADGVSEDQIFRQTLFFLKEPARQIFLAKKRTSTLTCWNDVIKMLRQAFDPGNAQYNLRQRLNKMIQGQNEGFATFLARIINLIECITPPMSEYEKVEIVKRNMRPDISVQLATHDISTMSRLEILAMRVEKNLCELSGNYKTVNRMYANRDQNKYNQICELDQDCEQNEMEEYSDYEGSERDDSEINQINQNDSNKYNRPYNNQKGNYNNNYNRNNNNSNNLNPKNNTNTYVRRKYCYICENNEHFTNECMFNPRVVAQKLGIAYNSKPKEKPSFSENKKPEVSENSQNKKEPNFQKNPAETSPR